MPDLSPQATHVYPRSRGRRGKSSTLDLATERGLRSRFRSNLAISTLPALVGIAAAWLVSHEAPAGRMPWTWLHWPLWCVRGSCSLADRRGATLARRFTSKGWIDATAARQWVERFDAVAAEGRKNIAQLLEQVSRGERLQLPDMATDSASPGNSFAVFDTHPAAGQHEALQAISQAAAR